MRRIVTVLLFIFINIVLVAPDSPIFFDYIPPANTRVVCAECSDSVSVHLPSWLDSFEVPANNAEAVSEQDSLYCGCYCHALVKERFGETKACIYNTDNPNQKIVVHTFQRDSLVCPTFIMLFDRTKKCALWVAYRHDPVNFADSDIGRKDGWSYDPALERDWQPNLAHSYKPLHGVSFDRGHQMASNDRQTTLYQNNQTFYYSNMTPQCAKLNRGQWGHNEALVQGMMSQTTGSDVLYIVTGPFFDGDIAYTKDDSDADCAVPTGYFKCVMRCSFDGEGNLCGAHGCAFAVETNSDNVALQPCSIDYVESKTGFDFFAAVPDKYENSAESQSSAL